MMNDGLCASLKSAKPSWDSIEMSMILPNNHKLTRKQSCKLMESLTESKKKTRRRSTPIMRSTKQRMRRTILSHRVKRGVSMKKILQTERVCRARVLPTHPTTNTTMKSKFQNNLNRSWLTHPFLSTKGPMRRMTSKIIRMRRLSHPLEDAQRWKSNQFKRLTMFLPKCQTMSFYIEQSVLL